MPTTQRLPMTPGRVTALVIGAPVALAIIFAVAASIVANFGEDSIPVDQTIALQGTTAAVTVDNPDITLSASAAPGRLVRVRGELTGAFIRPEFDLRATAEGVTMSSHCVIPTGSCTGSLDVTVPAGLPVLASDANGNLTASGLSGQVSLSAWAGDLTAQRLSGNVALSDSSGELTASGLSGSAVRLSNSAGDITVTGLAATDVTGNVSSGDITLTFTRVPQHVDVTASSGDITLVLPPGPAYYQVAAQASGGSISVGVNRRSSSPHVINARDNSGDITIKY
jgi:hypothetical protein